MLKYDNIFPFIDGLAKVKLNGKYGFIDKSGKEVISIIYDNIEKFNYLGLAKVKLNKKKGLINTTGKEIIPIIYDDLSYTERGLVRVKLNDKWGVIDTTLKEIVLCMYDHIYSFINGLAKVKINNKLGFINETGKEVISCIYDDIGEFNNLGLAKVKLDNKYGFINKTGEKVLPCIYDDIGEFSYFGLARIKLDNKYGFINTKNIIVIPIQYDDINFFENGLFKVKLDDKWGCIDRNGKEVTSCVYDDIDFFENGLFKVKLYDRWGCIDRNDEEVIPCVYDDINFLENGLINAKLDNKYGFINIRNKIVIPIQYDDINYISDELISAKLNDKWGYIDSRNKIVIPFVYDDVSNFKFDLARVKFNGKYGFIDGKGKEVTAIFTASEVPTLKMENDLFPKFDNSLNTTEITIDGIEKNGVKIVKYKEPLFVPFKSYYPKHLDMNVPQKEFYFYWRNQVKEENYIKTDLSYIFIYIYELINNIGYDNPDEGYYLLLNVWLKYRVDFPELNRYLFYWIIDFIFVNRPTIKIDDFIEYISKNGIDIFSSFNDYYLYFIKHFRFIMNSYFTIKKDNILTLPAIEAISNYKITGSRIYSETTKEIIDNTIQDIIKLVNNYFLKKSGRSLLEFFKPVLVKFIIQPYSEVAICFINETYTFEYYSYTTHESLKKFITNIIRYTENIIRKEFKYSGRLTGISLEKEYSDLIDEYFARKNEKKKKVVSPIEIDFSKVKKLEEESLDVVSMLTTDIDYHNEIDILKNKIFDSEIKEKVKESEIINNQKNMGNDSKWLNNFNNIHREIIQAIIEKKEIDYITDIANRYSSMPEILIDEINGIANDNIGDFLIETGSSTFTIINEYEEMVKNFLSEG